MNWQPLIDATAAILNAGAWCVYAIVYLIIGTTIAYCLLCVVLLGIGGAQTFIPDIVRRWKVRGWERRK